MKIYIVGPSCVGKTTLARKIAKKLDLYHLDLDLIFWEVSINKGGQISLKFKEKRKYEEDIRKFLKEKGENWIVEGVYCVEEIMKKADVIIYLRLPFVVPLFRQWKRYLTDKFQRERYGFKSNLTYLMPDIWKQYLSDRGCDDLNNPLVFSNRKTEKIIADLAASKIKKVFSGSEAEKLVKSLKK